MADTMHAYCKITLQLLLRASDLTERPTHTREKNENDAHTHSLSHSKASFRKYLPCSNPSQRGLLSRIQEVWILKVGLKLSAQSDTAEC